MQSDVVRFKLDCAELDPSQLQALTRDLVGSLSEAGVGDACAAPDEAAPGQKGEVVTIGVILLTLIQAGGVAERLLEVLRAFIERKSTLRFELTRADGRSMSLDSSWFGKTQPESVQRFVTDFLKD